MAEPTFQDNKVILGFSFPFHQKRLSEAKNQQKVIDVIKEVYGDEVELDCVLKENQKSAKHEEKPVHKDSLESITNIFGSAEVLES